MAGDLTVSGNDIFFGAAGATVSATPSALSLTAGDADTDSLTLRAGNTFDDGQINLAGDGLIEFRAGNGLFSFVNGNTAVETAALDASGNLQIDGALQIGAGFLMAGDLTVSGDDILFGSPGARVRAAANGLTLSAGDSDTDNMLLTAGNSGDDGLILLAGDGFMELLAGSGLFSFVNGNSGLETATLDSSGNLQIDGGLTVAASAAAPNGSITVAGVTGVPGEARIRHAATGSTGQANGALLAPSSSGVSPGFPGTIIETSVLGESAGIFLNGDSIALWSPGDNNRLLSVYDEDLLNAADPASVGAAEKFAIDGNGALHVVGSLFSLISPLSLITLLDFDNNSVGEGAV